MADDQKSVFRQSLEDSSSFLAHIAFPQIGLLMDQWREENKKEKDEAAESSGRNRSSKDFNNNAIAVIDSGFNEIHNDLSKTNIILNTQLEQQEKTNLLLERIFVGGGFGGHGGGGGFGGGGNLFGDAMEAGGDFEIGKKILTSGGKGLMGEFLGGILDAVSKAALPLAASYFATKAIDPKDKFGDWMDSNVPGASTVDNFASHIGAGRSYEEQKNVHEQFKRENEKKLAEDDKAYDNLSVKLQKHSLENNNNELLITIKAQTEALKQIAEEIKKEHKQGTDVSKLEKFKEGKEKELLALENQKSQNDQKISELDRAIELQNKPNANINLSPSSPLANRSIGQNAVPAVDENGSPGVTPAEGGIQRFIKRGEDMIKDRIHGHPTHQGHSHSKGGGSHPHYNDSENLSGIKHGSFAEVVQRGESRGDYGIGNYFDNNHRIRQTHFDDKNMTVGQVMQQQKDGHLFAAGAYQMIPNTLKAAVESTKIDPNKKFDKQTQDFLFSHYLLTEKRPSIGKYFMGQSDDIESAASATASEWAAVQYHGIGKYDKDGINHSSVPQSDVMSALKKGREIYAKTGDMTQAVFGLEEDMNKTPSGTFGKPDMAFGDSTAHRLGLKEGDTMDSRHTKDSLIAMRKKLETTDVKGKNVVMSSMSNDQNEQGFKDVTQMASELMDKGAKVNIMGMGPGGTYPYHKIDPKWNERLKDWADKNNAAFTPMGPSKDSIHEASPKDQLEAISKAHPGIQVFGHGQVNPSHKMHDEGKTITDAYRKAMKETPHVFASDKAHTFVPVLKRTIGAFAHGSIDTDGPSPVQSDTPSTGIPVSPAAGTEKTPFGSLAFQKNNTSDEKAALGMRTALQAHAFDVDTRAASTIHNFGIDKLKSQYAANRSHPSVDNSVNNLYTDKNKVNHDTSKPGKTDAGRASPSHDRIKKLFTSYGGNGDGWV